MKTFRRLLRYAALLVSCFMFAAALESLLVEHDPLAGFEMLIFALPYG